MVDYGLLKIKSMSTRFEHPQEDNSIYFVTFTCYDWLHLFETTDTYNLIYKWFDVLYGKGVRVTGYVTMPNHFHGLLYFPIMPQAINTVIGNAKRFMAYEIIEKLEASNQKKILQRLKDAVKPNEKKKGQLHKVFEDSFDAKKCYSKDFILQKLDYIHANPIRGRWQLVNQYTDYKHSSAGFYEETDTTAYQRLKHIGELL